MVIVFEAPEYQIDEEKGFIHGFTLGTDVSEVKSKLIAYNGSVTIVSATGNEATGIIATGQKIVVYDTAGNIKKEYSVVIYGDINGDGKVSPVDYVALNKYLWNQYNANSVQKEAMDVNHNSSITYVDLVYINKVIWEILTISQ